MAGRIVPNRPPSLDKRLPRNKRTKNEGKDAGYLAWLHVLPCCVSLQPHNIEAHHPTVGRGRMARKEDDATAVPIAADLHSDQYKTGLHRGEAKFWNACGIDPTSLADDLYAAYKAGAGPAQAIEIIYAHHGVAEVRKALGIKIFVEKKDVGK